MLKRLFPRADYVLLATVLLLCALGLVMVSSATRALGQAGGNASHKLWIQAVSFLLGLGLLVLLMSLDYSKLLELSLAILGTCGFLLLVTLLLGHQMRGSARWIPLGPLNFQPSEFAKIAVILAVGQYLGSRVEHTDLRSLRAFLTAGALAGGPAVMILLQPDLGTPLVIFFVWLTMMFLAGSRGLHLVAATLVCVLALSGAWHANLLRPHQKERISAFLNPERDPLKTGWQLKQSLIAVGSGHLLGQGLFQGSQSNLAFIPDQETDFIFAVVGEELGFVGSVFLLALLGVVVWRCYTVAALAKDLGGRLLAGGVAAMLSMQIVVNIGMVLGVLPVKGLPLPFLSYGGSAMLANLAAIGIVESVCMRRHKIAF